MKIMIAVALLSSLAVACPKGTIEYNGACYADPKPSDNVPVPETKPSDEKPPRHPEPPYQRGDVMAAMPPSEIANDTAADVKKKCAEISGKKKGHVPLTEDEKTFQDQCKK